MRTGYRLTFGVVDRGAAWLPARTRANRKPSAPGYKSSYRHALKPDFVPSASATCEYVYRASAPDEIVIFAFGGGYGKVAEWRYKKQGVGGNSVLVVLETCLQNPGRARGHARKEG